MKHWTSLNTVTKARPLDDEVHRCSHFKCATPAALVIHRVVNRRWLCTDHAWSEFPSVAALVLGLESA